MGEPLRTTGKRYIEMTTAEWVGRLLMPVNTFPSELKEGCGKILRLREEKEIRSAVEWLKEKLDKHDERQTMEDEPMSKTRIKELIDQAFPDLNTKNSEKAREE